MTNPSRTANRSEVEKFLKLHDAWKAGKNPWISVPNLNTEETNKKFIKKRANDVWGDRPHLGFTFSAAKKVEDTNE